MMSKRFNAGLCWNTSSPCIIDKCIVAHAHHTMRVRRCAPPIPNREVIYFDEVATKFASGLLKCYWRNVYCDERRLHATLQRMCVAGLCRVWVVLSLLSTRYIRALTNNLNICRLHIDIRNSMWTINEVLIYHKWIIILLYQEVMLLINLSV